MLTQVCVHTPHKHMHEGRYTLLCSGIWLRGFQGGSELPLSGWLTQPCPWPWQELMELVHLHLVKEYIVRLSKRRLVLKSAEQQQQLARHVLANADLIQRFCTQHVSPAPRALQILLVLGPRCPSREGRASLQPGLSYRAPRRPGCIKLSPPLPRSFTCKTPVTS